MIEGLFILPRDVLIEPVESLSEAVVARFEHRSGDFALTRPQSRTPTIIVNESTAKLLHFFREPATIVDAVIKFSQANEAEPGVVLDEAFSMLRVVIEAGILLPSDSHLASEIDFLLKPGALIGGMRINQSMAIVIDTEVYRAQTSDGMPVAIKIARLGSEERLRQLLAHEARILTVLKNSNCSPKLIAQGEQDSRPFLAMEWCRGVDAHVAAELARNRNSIQKSELKSILLEVIDVYAQLHESFVVHGDVHPRNVLICDSGKAMIIDFGHALILNDPIETTQRSRALVDLYMEPELARALTEQSKRPPPTPVGEQYSIAALLYYLLIGAHTHDFALEKNQLLRQLLCEPQKSFAERGILGFTRTERVLARALEKNPDSRFNSVKELRDALHEALGLDDKAHANFHRHNRGKEIERKSRLDELIGRATLDGALMREGIESPLASITFGAAGVGYAMLRIAQQREDSTILAVADVWSQMAIRDMESATAFVAPDLEMSAELIGKASLYHSNPGVICVAALVADVQADDIRRNRAIKQFIALATTTESRIELVFGLSGLLLGCALLFDSVRSTLCDEQALLLSLGNDLQKRLLEQLGDSLNGKTIGLPNTFGVAHGYAGVFYSLLQWAQVSKAGIIVEDLRNHIETLSSMAQPVGRGLAWPISTRGRMNWNTGLQASWCNGTGGQLQLWLLAYEILKDPIYLSLAQGAAWTTYETACNAADLCCGSAGRAYSLLRLFRLSGDRIWLNRAYELADHAMDTIKGRQLRQNSLYRGELGVCLLAAELNDPAQARMPLFELLS